MAETEYCTIKHENPLQDLACSLTADIHRGFSTSCAVVVLEEALGDDGRWTSLPHASVLGNWTDYVAMARAIIELALRAEPPQGCPDCAEARSMLIAAQATLERNLPRC